MEVNRHTFWMEIPWMKIRMHESLNQAESLLLGSVIVYRCGTNAPVYLCTFFCVYVCLNMYVGLCVYECICYTCIYKSSHVWIHVDMLAHISVSLYTCICVLMCICMCPVRQILASSMKELSALSKKKGYVKTVRPPSLEEIKKRRERFRDGSGMVNCVRTWKVT